MTSLFRGVWNRTSASQLQQAERAILQTIKIQGLVPRPVPLGDGNHINTIIAGDSALPPLVLLHGYGAGVGFWFKNLARLSQHYRVYAIDMLGFGRSSRPKTEFSKNNPQAVEHFFVDSLERWRQNVHLSNFHLLGHSFGGYVATAYAVKHPASLANRHLVLASPFGVPERAPPKLGADPKSAAASAQQSNLARLIERLWAADVTPPSVVRAAGPLGPYLVRSVTHARFSRLESHDADLLAEYLYHLWAASGSGEYALSALFAPMGWAYSPLLHRLRDIKIATSFIYGEYDWMRPEPVVNLIQSGANPHLREVHIMEGVGHQLALEDPVGFDRLVHRVLSEPVVITESKPKQVVWSPASSSEDATPDHARVPL